MQNIFAKHQPDALMHLAAESHVDRSIESPSEFITTNILGTFNLLETSRVYLRNGKAVKEIYFIMFQLMRFMEI